MNSSTIINNIITTNGNINPKPTPFQTKQLKVRPIDFLPEEQWDKLHNSLDWSYGQGTVSALCGKTKYPTYYIFWILRYKGLSDYSVCNKNGTTSVNKLQILVEAVLDLVEEQRSLAKSAGIDYTKQKDLTSISSYYSNIISSL